VSVGRKQAICPLRAGVVMDVEVATELLLRPLLYRSRRLGL